MTYFPPFPDFRRGQGGELVTLEKSMQIYHSPHNGPTGYSNIRDIITENGSATLSVTSGESEWNLATTALANDDVTMDSAVNARPIPGTLAELGFSIRIPTAMTGNQVAEWGLDDGTTGVGFGQNSTGNYVYVRKGGTQTKVQQSSWNHDALGGLGPSGLSLSTAITTATRFTAEFSSTFLGLIDFYVYLWNTSTYEYQKVLVHRWAPSSGAVDSAPFAPLRLFLDNDTTATATNLYCQERWFATTGKNPDPVFREIFQFRTPVSTSTTVLPLVSIRRKSGARNSRSIIYVTGFDLLITTAPLIVKVALDHGLTGASWVDGQTSAAETSTEVDISATAITGGSNKFVGLFNGDISFNFQGVDKIYLPADQTPVTLTCRTTTGTGSVYSCLRLAEEW